MQDGEPGWCKVEGTILEVHLNDPLAPGESTTRQFLGVMENVSNMVLDWYYQYFIETTKTIDYGINAVVDQGDYTYITLKRIDLTPMPIDLMITFEDGSKRLFYIPMRITRDIKGRSDYPNVPRTVARDWPWVKPVFTVKIEADASTIKSIEIDPTQRLVDINRENNKIVFDELTEVETQ